MEHNQLPNQDKTVRLRQLSWIFLGFAISSCLIRNDYNVLFAFVIVLILGRYYKENAMLYGKVLIHMLTVLVLVDVLWLVIIMPYWTAKPKSKIKNPYWESLEGIHTFGIIMAFVELVVKLGMAGLVFKDYKQNYPNDLLYLFKLGYGKVEPASSK